MKKKQIISILIVCAILVITGLIGVNSAITMNKLRKNSSQSAQKNLEQMLGVSEEKISLPAEDYIGQIDIVGTIQESDQLANSISSTESYHHDRYLKFIDEMEKDKTNKGIFLYVNSPGGTVYASDELYLKLVEYKEKTGRPVYAYFASEACSGAYYISMAADKIYANRNCWTGSVGVIISLVNYEQLMEKIGVTSIDITSGANKTIGSAAHKMTREQEKILQDLVDESYEQFTQIVADGRKMDMEKVKKLADGRIYSANQARKLNMIDEIMGLDDAKTAIATSLGNKDLKYYIPENSNTWKKFFVNLNGLSGLLGYKSDIQAAREMMEQDESGVLMYYAK